MGHWGIFVLCMPWPVCACPVPDSDPCPAPFYWKLRFKAFWANDCALKNFTRPTACFLMILSVELLATPRVSIYRRTHSDDGRLRWLSWMRVRLVIGRLRVRPPPGRQLSFMEIDHVIFLTVILSLPLIQEGHNQFLAKEWGQYWLTA